MKYINKDDIFSKIDEASLKKTKNPVSSYIILPLCVGLLLRIIFHAEIFALIGGGLTIIFGLVYIVFYKSKK